MRSSSPGEVVVHIHALQRYIQRDFSDGTGGELILDLYLQRDGDGWTVVRSDAVSVAERHARL
jgi:hypothetical protein